MAVYHTDFLYLLDQNGSSINGKVDELILNSEAISTEETDDGVISIGEQFTATFTDPTTDAIYTGTYVYIGHDPALLGVIARDVNNEFYMFSNDGNIEIGQNLNGLVAEDVIVCFLPGTMIACPQGERAVESLSTGDPVLTADGRTILVKWIGRQTILSLFGMPEGRCPVTISAGALGDSVPARELRVTSDHALLLDGLLVQAGALVNGDTIRRIPRTELGERFTIFHVETENHEIILAEGAPTETFVDNVSRRRFDNYAEFEKMFGGEVSAMEELPQPRAMSARQIPLSVRARIRDRAAALRALGSAA
jgi:hypothetical protein